MPEQRGKGPERCSVHPSRPTVAICDECGRPMCLACTIPVRGLTLGGECLATVLGPDAPAPKLAGRESGTAARFVARLAFVVAVAATALPWSRFGAGSESFGAWSTSISWSMVAAVASVAGLAVSLSRRFVSWWRGALDLAAVIAGAVVSIGALIAVIRPPAFTSPWVGPWVAAGAGILATVASAVALQGTGHREHANV